MVLLPLEEALWRVGHWRAAASEAARGREPQAEAARRGPQPRQAHFAGCSVKKALRPDRRRELVRQVQATHGVSERRSCVALGIERSTIRCRSTKTDQAPLRLRIRDLAKTRVRYGYFRIYILLRREGWMVNHKRVYRLYREEGLSLRLKRPRRPSAPPIGNASRQRPARTSSGRWASSPTRCSMAGGFAH